jgi:hypothetical protein
VCLVVTHHQHHPHACQWCLSLFLLLLMMTPLLLLLLPHMLVTFC